MTLAYNMYRAAEEAAKKAAAEAFNDGFSAGEERGMTIGREEGRNEGISLGITQAKLETAKKFLSMGLSVEQVADGTGLSIEVIQDLADK